MSNGNKMEAYPGRWISMLATMLLLISISMAAIIVWYGLRSPVKPYRAEDVVFAIVLLAFPVVGWLIAVRRPQNPLGWIYLSFPLALTLGATSEELAILAAQ